MTLIAMTLLIIHLFNLVLKFLLQRCNLDFQPNKFVVLAGNLRSNVFVAVDRHKQVIVKVLKSLLQPPSLQVQRNTREK